jgi:osmotically inducible protein OsmC
MAAVLRTAEVEWTGSILRGAGLLSGGSGAMTDLPLTVASRIGQPESKTSPEELIAAAHAACFTLAVGSILARQGTPPERHVTATVTLKVSGRPTITSSQLDVHGVVPGADAVDVGAGVVQMGRCGSFHALSAQQCKGDFLGELAVSIGWEEVRRRVHVDHGHWWLPIELWQAGTHRPPDGQIAAWWHYGRTRSRW